ncbi:MAG: O-antigen ligase family protein [Oscillospiraceae bacterium]|nr:O-antigen ligase family protein [Oscillospiraceae bacterium]
MIGNKAFYGLRLLIMIIFTVYGMMQRLTPLGFICDSYIIPAVMLILSAVYLIWDIFTRRNMFKARYTVLLIAFIAVTALSSLINIKYGVYTNIMIMIYLAVDFLIFYQFGNRDIAEVKREFRIIGYIIAVMSLIYVLISLSTYFLCMEYQYVMEESGRIIEQGYQSGYRRVWGFYYETNFQGLMAIVVIYFSLLNIKNGKNRPEKGFNALNAVIHLIMLVLTGSRSSTVAFYVSVFVCAFYFAKSISGKFDSKFWRELTIRTISAGLACIAAFGIISAVKQSLPYLQQYALNNVSQQTRLDYADFITRIYAFNGKEVEFKNLNVNYNEHDGGEAFERQEIVRLDIETKDDRSNGRIHVWRDSFKLFTLRPLLGVSPSMSNRAEFAKIHFPDACEEIVTGVSLLNGYLEVLIGGGLVSVTVTAVFFILCLKKLMGYQQKKHTHRTDLGFLTAILVGMLTFVLFTTDLFYSRTVYTYFFWITLGYGMYLIEYDEKNDKKNNNFAVLCDTPIQIMNAVRFAENHGNGDIYIYHQFNASREISDRLKNLDIFNNVYDIEKYKPCNKIITFLRLIFPRYTINKYSSEKIPFNKKDYGTLVLCAKTPFAINMHIALDTADVIMLEEGAGVYFVNVNRDTTRLFRFMDEIVFGGRLKIEPSAIYVSNTELYSGKMTDNCIQLPQCSAECIENLEKIFDYHETNSYDKKTVCLTQPLDEIDGTLKISESELLKNISEAVGGSLVIKLHPRMQDFSSQGLTIAENNLWELECLKNKITDDRVLISCFSTAQLIPKILLDCEPTLIFTYRILFTEDSFKGERWQGIIGFIDKLKKIYRSPEKIFVPQTKKELIEFLKRQYK